MSLNIIRYPWGWGQDERSPHWEILDVKKSYSTFSLPESIDYHLSICFDPKKMI